MPSHVAQRARTTRGSRRRTRLLSGLLTAALGAGLLAAVPTAAHAAGNSLYFPNGSDHVDVGANAALFIDGTITFDATCTYGGGTGIDDFVYPATDVYIVEAGSATDGATLKDAAGENPNTIVGTGSGAFLGELIGVVTPTGRLGEGVFDVVYDTCQNGTVDEGDEIFSDAITVEVPDGQLPAVDSSIRLLKDRAREEYAAWLKTHIGLTALFKFEDARNIASCILSAGLGCLVDVLLGIYDLDGVMAQSSDWIEGQTLNLVANRAANYGAIWQDPADPDFDHLPVVEPHGVRVPPATGQPIPDAFAALTEPLAEEGALTDALLHALERYQGAQAKGDEEWALVQARAVRDLSAALDAHLGTDSAVADLRDAIAGDLADVEANAAAGAGFVNRVRSSGFTPDEKRILANRGLTQAEVRAMEDAYVAGGPAHAPTGEQVLAMLDQLLGAQEGMREALDASATGWDDLVTGLEDRVENGAPEADAGGPYTAPGGTVTLDASGSTPSPGAALIRTYRWDLDGDGDHDDAAGERPPVTLAVSRTVSVEVTDDRGLMARDFARVTVTGGDRSPVLGTTTPANATTVTVGDTRTFTVAASDPDGDALAYRWTVGGKAVDGADGPSYGYAPTVDDVGEHAVSVTVTGARRAAAYTWSVSVLRPDTDGDGWTRSTDCDDTRADIHPGGYERLGNGVDDDCDDRTADAPPGGLTGSVWSWGDGTGVGRLPVATAYSPVPLTSLGSTVRAIESAYGRGYAVLADGTVRSWGSNYSGALGDGTQNTSYVPRTVRNVGDTGPLGDVVEVASDDDHVLALRQDGSVVAWGSNVNQQLGDNSTVGSRLTPVETVLPDGSPLTGVAQVEAGETTSYAVMADGTVRIWGVVHCDGDGPTTTRRNTADTNPLFGDGVLQVASGDSGGAVVRKADGSVWACSAYRPLVGREGSLTLNNQVTPTQVTGLGKGAGIVDVAMGNSTALALAEDGTVWTWGRNLNHTLDIAGIAPDYQALTPIKVPLPAGPPVVDVESDYAATMFATRADGSVVVWGANVNGGGGVGAPGYAIVEAPQINLGGNRAIAVANSVWNGLALVRPADDPVWERPAQWVSASVADTEVVEGAQGSALLTLSDVAPEDLTVTYTVGDGEPRTATVPRGRRTADLPVSVEDDALDEDDTTLALQLRSVSHGVRVEGGAAVVTVHDDDAAPDLSVGDVTVAEGSTSLTDVAVPVTLSAPSGKDVEVEWSTADGSAESPADYAAAHGVAQLPPGTTKAVLHLSVVGDVAVEADESLTVSLAAPVSAGVADGEATVTVTDDEPLLVTVSAPSVTEGDSGTTPASFVVSTPVLPAGETVTVPWSVEPGTAELGDDVVAGSGEVSLTSDARSASVEAGVVADTVPEPLAVETFSLAAGKATSSAGRPVVVDDSAAAAVTDDDVAVTVDAGPDVSGTEGAPVAVTGSASAVATWSVDEPGCTVADPADLSTTVTCVDQTVATLTLSTPGGVADTAGLTIGNVAPTLEITAPADGTTVPTGALVTVSTTVSDPGADDVTCTVAWGDGASSGGCAPSHAYTAAGAYPVVVTADDGDGGMTAKRVQVTVTAPAPDPEGWPFEGFFAPVDSLPVVNVVKAGSTVPVKFSVGGYRGMDIFAPGYPASTGHTCGSDANLDAIEETVTPGESVLTYDPLSGRYHYNWQTQKSWAGSCRTLIVKLADGSVRTAEFRLK